MAPRSLWSTLPLFLLLAPSLAVENDFSFYPSGARTCLYDSADAAGCSSGTIAALNTCLCGNNNDFVINTAKCLGESDSGDVDEVYDTMSSACSDSSTPLSVTKDEFQDAAAEGASGTTTSADDSSTTTEEATSSATESEAATTTDDTVVTTTAAYTTTNAQGSTVTVIATSTSTGSGSSSGDDNDGGFSTPATIGVGVGAAIAGAGVVGAIVFFILRRRRRRDEESHPMLLQNQQGTPQNPTPFAPPPGAPSPAVPSTGVTYNSDSKSSWAGGVAPSPATTGGWTSPSHGTPQYPYAVPGQPHLSPGGVPQMQQPQVFEMDSSQTVPVPPVEMPGSAFQR